MWRDVLFWMAAAACVVAQVAIIRSSVRPYAPDPENDRVPRPHTGLEVAWVLLPAVVLVIVFAYTWRAIHP
jgi:heme/copper-type cytochrome/quinol oxidase subunit 2